MHEKMKPEAKSPGESKAAARDPLFGLLLEAQEAMENLPMGGIGRDGATEAELAEAEEAGRTAEDDACYHQGQRAWLILERAKALLDGRQ